MKAENSNLRGLHTVTIRVAAAATLTHIREEITTFPAQTSVAEIILTEMAAIDTPMEEVLLLTVAPVEVANLIAEGTNLDMMTDAETIDLGMKGTTNPPQEMINWLSPINLRSWTGESTAQERVVLDSMLELKA